MKKTVICSVMALALESAGISKATVMSDASIAYLLDGGSPVVEDSNVEGSIGGGEFAISSTTAFYGNLWTAHDGITFGPGTYTFDTQGGGLYTGITVGEGQVGGRILWDWAMDRDVDLVFVWDVSCDGVTCAYTTTDPDGDGVLGTPILEGTWRTTLDFVLDFTIPDVSAVPLPTALWLFGSGLIGLLGVARKKKVA